MLPGFGGAPGGQSSHEGLPKALERLQQVYRCLSVYLLCVKSYKPMVPGMVLPCAELVVKQSALRRFAVQNAWVHTNSPSPLVIAQRDMLRIPAHAL